MVVCSSLPQIVVDFLILIVDTVSNVMKPVAQRIYTRQADA